MDNWTIEQLVTRAESAEKQRDEALARVERLRTLVDYEERDFDLEARYAAAEAALEECREALDGLMKEVENFHSGGKFSTPRLPLRVADAMDRARAALSGEGTEKCPTCERPRETVAAKPPFVLCSDPFHSERQGTD